MFFNLSVLKRMIKIAYNTCGLYVGHRAEGPDNYESYYMSSGWWVVSFDCNTIPKEVKAAVINLTGELPEVGKLFVARKNEPIQYEIESFEMFIQESSNVANIDYIITDLVKEESRIAVCIRSNITRTVELSETIISLIDVTAIDSCNDEKLPVGPCATHIEANVLYWQNDRCALAAYIRKDDENEQRKAYIDALGEVFRERGNIK